MHRFDLSGKVGLVTGRLADAVVRFTVASSNSSQTSQLTACRTGTRRKGEIAT
jgi:hypothetical protein